MPKNILIVSDRFANGGLETHIFTYVKKMQKCGYRLFLLSNYEQDYNFTFFEGRYCLKFADTDTIIDLFSSIEKIERIIEKEEIDIVYVHPFLSIIPTFFATQRAQVPLITTLHGPGSIINARFSKMYSFFIKIIVPNFSDVIFVSEELKAISLGYGKEDNQHIISNPVDVTLFQKAIYNNNPFSKWAIVSRIDFDKLSGIQETLQLAKEYHIKQIDIYGDGEALEELKAYVEYQGIYENVIFKGFSKTLNEALQEGYSLIAGMGRVLLEAAAMNIPTLLVGYDGIKGLVDESLFLKAAWSNFSGRGIENCSLDELNDAFNDLKMYPNKYFLRDIVESEFSIDILFTRYEEIIQKCRYQAFPYKEVENIFKLSDNKRPYLQNFDLLEKIIIYLKNKSEIPKNIHYNLKCLEREWGREKMKEQIIQLEEILKRKEDEIKELNKINMDSQQKREIDQKNQELNSIYSSNFWKVASKYYALKEHPFMYPFVKIGRSIKKIGPIDTVKKIIAKSAHEIEKHKNEKKHLAELEEILVKHPQKTIIILPMLVDWNIPLFQRPQHLAKNLAKEGFLYFYCTGNMQYDHIDGFEEISKNCYLTNRFDLVDKIEGRRKFYDLSSTDNITDWHFVIDRLQRGDGIIYQYIDEISDDLSGFTIPKKTWEKHTNILKDERCIVIPSATKLENDVKKHRSKNYKLVTNGVEIEHFSKDRGYEEYPKEIKKIVDKKKPIIGYFGAFASWFDYELVKKLAKEREDLEIVLLGWDYDGSIKKAGFKEFENIIVLGPIEYQKLPNYATCFDVSTIPFVINDITESTSPIKLFEYMAMGKPIVTTDMPECRKYESVLIGKKHEEFIQKIDEALSLVDDKEYKKILKKEANENSWESKAKDIVSMLSGFENRSGFY